ncbi:hypothetical protein [uncultured Mediterranean phage uvMED]|nr:hypothetical protein [uncultured Mediterranean phage uvMED]
MKPTKNKPIDSFEFLNRPKDPPDLMDHLIWYNNSDQKIEGNGAVIQKKLPGTSGDHHGSWQYLSGSYHTWSTYSERAYIFANEKDAQDLIKKFPEELSEAIAKKLNGA